ncbi:hypothetical protein KC366_g94 [Hortaea werneckii]|nr:hypothetical protein KC366_g94 [Hortaea werneckii]
MKGTFTGIVALLILRGCVRMHGLQYLDFEPTIWQESDSRKSAFIFLPGYNCQGAVFQLRTRKLLLQSRERAWTSPPKTSRRICTKLERSHGSSSRTDAKDRRDSKELPGNINGDSLYQRCAPNMPLIYITDSALGAPTAEKERPIAENERRMAENEPEYHHQTPVAQFNRAQPFFLYFRFVETGTLRCILLTSLAPLWCEWWTLCTADPDMTAKLPDVSSISSMRV